ncbi:MAG: hypothetical protein ABMA14_25150 [Hyphomonadaceae bacterium]
MSSEVEEHEAQVVHAIERWHRPSDLVDFACKGHGFGDSDGGFGVVYASDLDECERGDIPEGFVEVYGFWGATKGGFEFVIDEREYLRILAKTLRAKALCAEAAIVEGLIRKRQ